MKGVNVEECHGIKFAVYLLLFGNQITKEKNRIMFSKSMICAALVCGAMMFITDVTAQTAPEISRSLSRAAFSDADTTAAQIERMQEMRRARRGDANTSGSPGMRGPRFAEGMRGAPMMLPPDGMTSGMPPMRRGDRMTSGMPPMMRDGMTSGMPPIMRGNRMTSGAPQMSPEMIARRDQLRAARTAISKMSNEDKEKMRSLTGEERTAFLKEKGIEFPSTPRGAMGPGPQVPPNMRGQMPAPPTIEKP